MNDKEGLEEAKNTLKEIEFIKNQRDFKQEEIAKAYFTEKWGDWLIKQAERADYLEKREQKLIETNQHELKYRAEVETINAELEQQNKRYREILYKLIREENNINYVKNLAHEILEESK